MPCDVSDKTIRAKLTDVIDTARGIRKTAENISVALYGLEPVVKPNEPEKFEAGNVEEQTNELNDILFDVSNTLVDIIKRLN